MKIIALVGLCGSGKSTLSCYLEGMGYKKVYFGALTIQEIKKNNMSLCEDNERMIREKIRFEYGMGAYALLNLPKINDFLDQEYSVIIDGLYSFSEFKVLEENFESQLKVIAIFTPKELRYYRLSQRKDRPLTLLEAKKRDYTEIQNLEKGGPIAIADQMIINDDSLEKVKVQMKKILNNF